jgi:hypothetical protein
MTSKRELRRILPTFKRPSEEEMIDPKSDDLQRRHWLSRIASNRVTTVQAIFVFLIATSHLCAGDKTFDFANDFRPILSDDCYHCHGPDANAREADLRLDDRTSGLDADLFASGAMLERLTSDDPDFACLHPIRNCVEGGVTEAN